MRCTSFYYTDIKTIYSSSHFHLISDTPSSLLSLFSILTRYTVQQLWWSELLGGKIQTGFFFSTKIGTDNDSSLSEVKQFLIKNNKLLYPLYFVAFVAIFVVHNTNFTNPSNQPEYVIVDQTSLHNTLIRWEAFYFVAYSKQQRVNNARRHWNTLVSLERNYMLLFSQ